MSACEACGQAAEHVVVHPLRYPDVLNVPEVALGTAGQPECLSCGCTFECTPEKPETYVGRQRSV